MSNSALTEVRVSPRSAKHGKEETPGRRAVEKGLSLPFPEPPETAFQRAKRYSRAIAKHGVGPRKFRARIVCAALKEGLRG